MLASPAGSVITLDIGEAMIVVRENGWHGCTKCFCCSSVSLTASLRSFISSQSGQHEYKCSQIHVFGIAQLYYVRIPLIDHYDIIPEALLMHIINHTVYELPQLTFAGLFAT